MNNQRFRDIVARECAADRGSPAEKLAFTPAARQKPTVNRVQARGIGGLGSLLVAVLVVAAGACSDDTDAERALRAERLSQVEGFCSEWALEACNPTVVEHCAAASEDACRSSQSLHCGDLMADRAYNPDFAEHCLRAVSGALGRAELDGPGYSVVTELGGDCAFLGSLGLPVGATCLNPLDCDPSRGLVCVGGDGEQFGSCETPTIIPGGSTCGAPGAECADGFYCDGSNCLARRARGQSCGTDEPCGAALECQNDACVDLLDVGADCESAQDCLSDLCVPTGANTATPERLCTNTLVLSVSEPLCSFLR